MGIKKILTLCTLKILKTFIYKHTLYIYIYINKVKKEVSLACMKI